MNLPALYDLYLQTIRVEIMDQDTAEQALQDIDDLWQMYHDRYTSSFNDQVRTHCAEKVSRDMLGKALEIGEPLA